MRVAQSIQKRNGKSQPPAQAKLEHEKQGRTQETRIQIETELCAQNLSISA